MHTLTGKDVHDYGNISYEPEKIEHVENMTHLTHVAACSNQLSETVQKIIKDQRQVLTIGGDHSVSIGSIDGHVKVRIINE